jgi:hypothetical protein
MDMTVRLFCRGYLEKDRTGIDPSVEVQAIDVPAIMCHDLSSTVQGTGMVWHTGDERIIVQRKHHGYTG